MLAFCEQLASYVRHVVASVYQLRVTSIVTPDNVSSTLVITFVAITELMLAAPPHNGAHHRTYPPVQKTHWHLPTPPKHSYT